MVYPVDTIAGEEQKVRVRLLISTTFPSPCSALVFAAGAASAQAPLTATAGSLDTAHQAPHCFNRRHIRQAHAELQSPTKARMDPATSATRDAVRSPLLQESASILR